MTRDIARRLQRLEARMEAAIEPLTITVQFVDPKGHVTKTLRVESRGSLVSRANPRRNRRYFGGVFNP